MTAPRRNSEALFSEVFLPEETKAVKREVREAAEHILRPVAHQLNTTAESVAAFPRDVFDALANQGLTRFRSARSSEGAA